MEKDKNTRKLQINGFKWLFLSVIGFFLIFLVIWLIFIPTNSILSSTTYGITDFQLAFTDKRMNIILSNWNSIIDVVIYQTWWDFLFIAANLMFILGIGMILHQTPNIERFTLIKQRLIPIIITGPLSDAMENIFSLLILYSPTHFPPFFPFLVGLFASLKFLFLTVSFGMIVVLLIGKWQNHKKLHKKDRNHKKEGQKS